MAASIVDMKTTSHPVGDEPVGKGSWLVRIVSVFGLVMMMVAAFGFVRPAATLAGEAGTINTNNVEIFEHPTDLTIIGSLDSGDRVDIFWGLEYEMYEVRAADGTVGWVWAEFLDLDGGAGASVASSDSSESDDSGSSSAADQANLWSWSDWVQVDADSLNARADAYADAPVVNSFSAGEWVLVIGDDVNGWTPIDNNGDVAWISSKYISWDGTFQYASGNPVASGGGSSDSASESSRSTASEGEHWIDVNGATGEVNLMVGNQSIATYWGSVGYDTSSDGFYSTASGTFYVYAMYEPLGYTAWADAYITNWVGFDPSRSNGFHSYSKDANGNVLPNGAGKTGGCVALPAGAIQEVYNFAFMGMRVEVHR